MDTKTKNEIAESALKAGIIYRSANDVTIRVGDAPEAHNPEGVIIGGTLDAPLRWLRVRGGALDHLACHIIADRNAMKITLVCNEKSFERDVIAGALVCSPEISLFGINQNRRLTNFEMARLFKMNRSFFESKANAMELVTILQNFKAKVETDLEKADNRRGDTRSLRIQAVQSNLPESFKLCVPIFKGGDEFIIDVEVDVDPDDFSCALVSPQLADIARKLVREKIKEVTDCIKDEFPDVVVIDA